MHVVKIPLDRLILDPDQPRTAMADGAFARLVASIGDRGLLQPIRVKPADAAGRHVIVFGHRRAAALAKLGWTHADCVVADAPPDVVATTKDQLQENLVREALSPVEEAAGYRRYLDLTGLTAARAAEDLHVEASRIARCLPLLDLPAEVRELVHSRWIPRDTAYHLARLPAGAARDRLLARAVAGDLDRDEAARAAKVVVPESAAPPSVGRVTCKLGGGRSLTVAGGAVTLDALIAALEDVLKAARKGRAQGWTVGTLAKVFRDRAAKGGAA